MKSVEGTFILESSASRAGALVACALVSPEQGRVPVSLLNPRDESITVKAGTAIATLEMAEIPETLTPFVTSVATGANATQEQESMVRQLVEESREKKRNSCTHSFYRMWICLPPPSTTLVIQVS